MMRNALVILCTAALAVAGFLLHGVRREAERDRQLLSALASSVDGLKDRPPNVMRLIEHETRVESCPSASPEKKHVAEKAGQDAPAAPNPPGHRGTVGGAERAATAFADEPIDHLWADEAGRSLNDAIRTLGISNNIESLSCRSSLCQIQWIMPDLKSYDHAMDALAGGGPAGPSGADAIVTPSFDETEDGKIHAISYWVRQGHMGQTGTWWEP